MGAKAFLVCFFLHDKSMHLLRQTSEAEANAKKVRTCVLPVLRVLILTSVCFIKYMRQLNKC